MQIGTKSPRSPDSRVRITWTACRCASSAARKPSTSTPSCPGRSRSGSYSCRATSCRSLIRRSPCSTCSSSSSPTAACHLFHRLSGLASRICEWSTSITMPSLTLDPLRGITRLKRLSAAGNRLANVGTLVGALSSFLISQPLICAAIPSVRVLSASTGSSASRVRRLHC